MSDSKTITLTWTQAWSIFSGLSLGLCVGIFYVSMIYFRFLSVEGHIKTMKETFRRDIEIVEEREIKKHNRQQEQIDQLLKQKQ